MTSRIISDLSPAPTRPNARLPVVISPYANEPPMPAAATGTLFMLASGFGIGALVIFGAFVFLIGIGEVGQHAATPAAQSAANAPAAPGPAPKPAPNTGSASGAVHHRTGARPGQSADAEGADRQQQQQNNQSYFCG